MAVATPLMERVTRQNQPSVFVSVDVLDLDEIQAKHGSHERHNAIILAAGVVWSAFRRSDVVARVNKESFGILAIDCSAKNFPIMEKRVQEVARQKHHSERWPFKLHLRIGYVQIDKDTKNHDAETLLVRARSMASH